LQEFPAGGNPHYSEAALAGALAQAFNSRIAGFPVDEIFIGS